MVQVRAILRELNLTDDLDVSTHELADFSEDQFKKADADNSGACVPI